MFLESLRSQVLEFVLVVPMMVAVLQLVFVEEVVGSPLPDLVNQKIATNSPCTSQIQIIK